MTDSGDISPGTVNGVSHEASATNAPQQPTTNGNLPLQDEVRAQQTPAQQNGQQNGAPNGNDASPQKPESRATGLKKTVNPIKKGPPGGFDTTPLPDAPPGYTVRFCFRCAANLPPADFNTASSDPFLTATLKAANPKRHKEDPDLVHRTRTLRRTTEPEWNDEWVVANVPRTGSRSSAVSTMRTPPIATIVLETSRYACPKSSSSGRACRRPERNSEPRSA